MRCQYVSYRAKCAVSCCCRRISALWICARVAAITSRSGGPARTPHLVERCLALLRQTMAPEARVLSPLALRRGEQNTICLPVPAVPALSVPILGDILVVCLTAALRRGGLCLLGATCTRGLVASSAVLRRVRTRPILRSAPQSLADVARTVFARGHSGWVRFRRSRGGHGGAVHCPLHAHSRRSTHSVGYVGTGLRRPLGRGDRRSPSGRRAAVGSIELAPCTVSRASAELGPALPGRQPKPRWGEQVRTAARSVPPARRTLDHK